jgi:hypothetical protein
MNTKSRFSLFTLLVSLLMLSLISSACASPTPASTAVVAKPTAAPTRPVTTVAPSLATATPAPTIAPTRAPTPIPSKVAPTTEPTTPPTTAAMEKILSIGEAQTVNDVSFLPSKYELMAQSGSDTPKTGDEFLVVTLSIENTSETDTFIFDPANIVILDPSGMDISMVMLKSQQNELSDRMLNPGEKLEGVIAFEVPKNENKWTLEYKITNGQNLEWSIS